MGLRDQLFWSMESVEDGYVDQPVVAIYIPERDGEVRPLHNVEIEGADVHYRSWSVMGTLEGMQQMQEHEQKEEEDRSAENMTQALTARVTHDDFSLFVIHPDVQPSWYETLGEVKELTGVLLSGELSEYGVNKIQALEKAVGMEHVYTSVGAACVGIERTLHRQKMKRA